MSRIYFKTLQSHNRGNGRGIDKISTDSDAGYWTSILECIYTYFESFVFKNIVL